MTGQLIPLIPFAIIIHGINSFIKYKEMIIKKDEWETKKKLETEKKNEIEKRLVELENEIERLNAQIEQNNSKIIKKLKKSGMSELQIREINNWVSQRSKNILDMARNGKIVSALTMHPDNMTKVPAGKFLYGDEKTEISIDYDYFIDVFPVTNEQYEQFVEQGGYQSNEYWSEDGNSWRQNQKTTEPEFWNNRKFNQPKYPVVGVSYYEAEAYGNWAGKSLPTEQEWERAARGTDGRNYPWGNEFANKRCNVFGHGTTPVSQYPNGLSPEGCYDMVGNVWEWTSSLYDEEKVSRVVVRGGGWGYDAKICRSAYRNLRWPDARGSVLGFRLARSIALGP